MNRTRLIELLSDPEKLDENTLDPLKEALDAYPFFQAGRMLWIKNLHKLDHIRYNSELKLAAAFIPDRARLFFLINDLFSPLAGSDEEHRDVDQAKRSAGETSDISGESNPSSQPESNLAKATLDMPAEGEYKDTVPEGEAELRTGEDA
ncbi:MAG: hypothetical protein ACOCZI_01660, partial [Marinilabiliaceae bacterium]